LTHKTLQLEAKHIRGLDDDIMCRSGRCPRGKFTREAGDEIRVGDLFVAVLDYNDMAVTGVALSLRHALMQLDMAMSEMH